MIDIDLPNAAAIGAFVVGLHRVATFLERLLERRRNGHETQPIHEAQNAIITAATLAANNVALQTKMDHQEILAELRNIEQAILKRNR